MVSTQTDFRGLLGAFFKLVIRNKNDESRRPFT